MRSPAHAEKRPEVELLEAPAAPRRQVTAFQSSELRVSPVGRRS